MRKRFVLFLAALTVACIEIAAQTFSVESFKLLDNDLTANTYGSIEYDQNGDVAALIKVITTQTGFVVDGGMMGIVKTKQEVAEFWIYVPHGIQRIKLRHPQLGQLEYYFPIPIEKARTYEMVLTTSQVRTIIDDQQTMQYLVMNISPANATVYIDDKLQTVESDGTLSVLLTYGSHSYRVEAASWKTQAGSVQMGKEKVTLDIQLESAKGTLTLECPLKEAELYLNNKFVGIGSWSGKTDPGNYLAEARLDGYRSRLMNIVLEEQEDRSFTLPAPQPMYGSMQINSSPKGAEILIDSVLIGETPYYATELLAKKHVVIIRKEGYQDYIDTIKIEEAERSNIDIKMSDILTATINSHPSGAELVINGKPYGTTPYTGELSTGDYRIQLTHQGYDPFDKEVHISVSKPEITLRMDKSCMKKNNVYVAGAYQVGNVSGIAASAGAYLYNLNLEAGYTISTTPEQRIYWSTAAQAGQIEKPMVYDYNISAVMGGKIGFGIRFGTQFRVTPQVGMNVMKIAGKSEGNPSQSTFVAQGAAALRLEYSPFKHFALMAAPEYTMPILTGQIAETLKDASDDIAGWYGGIAVRAGIEIYF